MIPEEVIDHYNFTEKLTADGWLYCEIQKAIYGLKEAGKLANIKITFRSCHIWLHILCFHSGSLQTCNSRRHLVPRCR